jgi:hypothetical protein
MRRSPRRSTFRRCRLSLAAIALTWATPLSAATVNLSSVPIPSWVAPVAPDMAPRSSFRARAGLEALLLETQTRFGPRGRAHFVHWADRITSAEGIDRLAPLRIAFDPGYQQVGVHFVRLRRGDRIIDVLRDATVKIVDLESELDRRLFDGRRSIVIVPRDLREGDVLEVAFTTTGTNPVFGGHAMGKLSLGGQAARRLRARLLVDTGLPPLHFKLVAGAPQPHHTSSRSGEEYVWDLADPQEVEYEDRTPAWLDDEPSVHWSDFSSWDAVRAWALPLYAPQAPSPAMIEKVGQWQKDHLSAEDRALAALRFVQDDIRYLGFELGPNSHAPHAPERVLAQRFGDCKDKSYLLATLLRAMGFEADPALVDSMTDGRVDQQLPSPFAFDHVIVRATAGGRVYWVDPTLSQQGGTLQTQATPPYGHALVLRGDARGLERIPEERNTGPLISLHERYEVEHDGAASLEIETVYRHSSADWARGYFTDASPERLTRRFVNFYAKRHPSISVVKSAQVSDDRRLNRLVLRETYAIPKFWQDDEIVLRGHLIDDQLNEPSVRLRKKPLALAYPVRAEHDVEVLMPEIWGYEPLDDRVEQYGIAFRRVVERAGRLISIHYRFATSARHVPAADTPKHLAALQLVRDRLDYRFWTRGGASTQKKASGWETAAGLAVIVGVFAVPAGLFFGVRRLHRGHRKRILRRRYEAQAGETAATAVPIASLDDKAVSAAVARVRCGCGGRLARSSDASTETSRLGEQEVQSTRFVCDRCGRARPIYFRLS